MLFNSLITIRRQATWFGDAASKCAIRNIPACGTIALRWLDVRLDPSNPFARLEKQIEAIKTADNPSGDTVADLDTNEALEKEILALYTDHAGAYDAAWLTPVGRL